MIMNLCFELTSEIIPFWIGIAVGCVGGESKAVDRLSVAGPSAIKDHIFKVQFGLELVLKVFGASLDVFVRV